MRESTLEVSSNRIAVTLQRIREKGVELWADNGQLHFRGPKGALDPDEIATLKKLKEEVVYELEKAGSGKRLAPLSFSQLAHYQSYDLAHQSAKRQIASATRLQGCVRAAALQESVTEIIRRHDSLRTRIVVCADGPMQEIDKTADFELSVIDMIATPDGPRQAEVGRQIERLILQPIDVAVGPLFDVRLLRLREDESVLIVVMDHMISDAYSMGIVLREIMTAYSQAVSGIPIALPEVAIQFSDYAARMRSENRSWIETHGAYWRERLNGRGRLRFPVDTQLQCMGRTGWGTVPIRIGPELLTQLRERSRAMRTTVVMTVFAAFVGLVLRWCSAREAVFQFQTDGRVNPKLVNTVGYCAAILLLRVGMSQEDTFIDLVGRVAKEYCRAYEHIDFSFLEAAVPRPELAGAAGFNWVPRVSTDVADSLGAAPIQARPVAIDSPLLKSYERDSEPGVLLYESDQDVTGGVYFPLSRFSAGTMERFAQNFLSFLGVMARRHEQRISRVTLV